MEHNIETGQTVLSGMGELHLDVIKSRLEKEYGLDVDLGPLQIAYKETIVNDAGMQYSLFLYSTCHVCMQYLVNVSSSTI